MTTRPSSGWWGSRDGCPGGHDLARLVRAVSEPQPAPGKPGQHELVQSAEVGLLGFRLGGEVGLDEFRGLHSGMPARAGHRLKVARGSR